MGATLKGVAGFCLSHNINLVLFPRLRCPAEPSAPLPGLRVHEDPPSPLCTVHELLSTVGLSL